MPKFINADQLKADETAAFLSVQRQLSEADRAINAIVHKKLHRILDDTPSASVRPAPSRERTGFPEKVENPDDVYIYDLITVIRCSDGQISAERFVSESNTLAGIKVSKGESVTVIAESGLNGSVYRYGCHGDYWEQIGEVCGYA